MLMDSIDSSADKSKSTGGLAVVKEKLGALAVKGCDFGDGAVRDFVILVIGAENGQLHASSGSLPVLHPSAQTHRFIFRSVKLPTEHAVGVGKIGQIRGLLHVGMVRRQSHKSVD
jgi:hypothetical protein